MASQPFPRRILSRVRQDLDLYPGVAIMGARQVGKSTLTRTLAGERDMVYLTLDDRDTRRQAEEDPEGLLDTLGDAGVVIDEVQRAPELLLAVKAVVDRDNRNGRFIFTGSNQPRVNRELAESLLGRVTYRTMRPLTVGEQRYDVESDHWSEFFDLSDEDLVNSLQQAALLSGELPWVDTVITGGMPRAVAARPQERLGLLEEYLRTFAARDVQEVLEVERPERFGDFLRLAASRTGQTFNASSYSRDLGVAPNTVARWMDALRRSFVVSIIEPYSRNVGQRIIKAPKTFMADSGLAIAGAGESTPTGFHLETLIANDLFVWMEQGPGRQLFHWRLQDGKEVDFVVRRGTKLLAVEVKSGSSVSRADARHLLTFLEKYPEAERGLVLSCDPEIKFLSDRIVAAPWWSVL
jgi:predicted AAA+ superfamily ATPase